MQCIYKLLWLCSARDVAGALSILCPSIIVRILCALRVCAGIFFYIGIICCADHAFLCPPTCRLQSIVMRSMQLWPGYTQACYPQLQLPLGVPVQFLQLCAIYLSID